MVWVKRVTLEPQQWLATMVDGYAPREDELREICQQHDATRHLPHTPEPSADLFDRAFAALREASRKAYQEGFTVFGNPCSLCWGFLLGLQPSDQETTGETPTSPDYLRRLRGEIQQDLDADVYRQIVLVEPGCGRMEKCLGDLLADVGFRVKEPSAYRDLEAFEQAATALLSDVLYPYEFPANVARRQLRRHGIAVTYC